MLLHATLIETFDTCYYAVYFICFVPCFKFSILIGIANYDYKLKLNNLFVIFRSKKEFDLKCIYF